jgi:hypothetical protein
MVQTSDIMLCGNSRQPCEGQVHKPTFLSTVTVFLVIIFIQGSSDAHRIQGVWGNEISGTPVTKSLH